MEKALAVVNQLELDGVIGRYAVGGAVAATRYIEPIQTYDLDVFVTLPAAPSGLLTITPIYSHLKQMGYEPKAEFIIIEGWAVQFLPVYDNLTEEALEQAIQIDFDSVPTRVFTAEHLAAIMLNTGRPKDHARLVQFFEFDAANRATLKNIIDRHDLNTKWDSFRKRLLNEME